MTAVSKSSEQHLGLPSRDQHLDELYRVAAELSPTALVMVDRKGRIVLVNRQAEVLFGYSRAELLGQPVELLVPERLRADHPRDRDRFFASPVSRSMGAGRDLYGRRKDGSEMAVEIGLNPIDTAQGLFVLSAIVDITQRKAEEAQLREAEQRFRLLVDGVPDYAIFMLDPQGRVQSWNAGAQRINGYSAEEIVGKHFGCFYLEEDLRLGKPAAELTAAVAHGRYEEEGLRVRKDGSQFWANVVVTPLYDAAGNLCGFSKITRDVTQRKKTEDEIHCLHEELEQRIAERTAQLEAANKELEAFSYSVSHDLRAPLRAIDGFSRILLADFAAELPAEARELLQDVRDNTQQMGQLVDDLLAFSRLSRQALRKEDVDPAALVRRCLEELKDQQRDRDVAIAIGELPSCWADRALLKQVWMNLLSNALKYTSRRETAVIEVGCRTDDSPTEHVYFVKDNGVGFDMRYAGKLFGVFQRLHRAEDYEGTGVGLAIVQRIVHRHGGRVWAEARPDEGSAFYFTLESEGVSNDQDRR